MSRVSRFFVIGTVCLSLAFAALAQDKVELRLNLKKGEAYPLSTTTKQDITQSAMGQTQQLKSEMGLDFTMRALDVDPQGVATVSIVYDRIRSTQSGPMGTQSYDSAAPDQKDNPMAASLGGLIGHELRMKVAPDGAISDIQGTEQLAKAMVDARKPADEQERKIIEEQVNAQWGPKTFQEMLGQNLSIFPKGPVAVGDSWDRDLSMTAGFPISVKTTYTLKSVDNGIATIDLRSVIHSAAQADKAQGMPVPVEYAFDGAQSGTIHLDLGTGWYRDGHMTQEFGGDVKLQAGGDQGTMTMPMKVKSDITMEVPKAKAAPAK